MSVARCQQEVDAREFAEWMAYYNIEPFGPEREDLRAGIVACTIANVNRGKGTRSMKPSDFVPKFGGKSRQSESEMEMRLLVWARMHNAKIKG
jgi:hypothetical protein